MKHALTFGYHLHRPHSQRVQNAQATGEGPTVKTFLGLVAFSKTKLPPPRGTVPTTTADPAADPMADPAALGGSTSATTRPLLTTPALIAAASIDLNVIENIMGPSNKGKGKAVDKVTLTNPRKS